MALPVSLTRRDPTDGYKIASIRAVQTFLGGCPASSNPVAALPRIQWPPSIESGVRFRSNRARIPSCRGHGGLKVDEVATPPGRIPIKPDDDGLKSMKWPCHLEPGDVLHDVFGLAIGGGQAQVVEFDGGVDQDAFMQGGESARQFVQGVVGVQVVFQEPLDV